MAKGYDWLATGFVLGRGVGRGEGVGMKRKPSKHDVIAQVLHFVHYIEDLAQTPKGLRHNVDTSVIKKKCDQVKRMLEECA